MDNSNPLQAQPGYSKNGLYDDDVEEGEIREGENDIGDSEIREEEKLGKKEIRETSKYTEEQTAKETPIKPSIRQPSGFRDRLAQFRKKRQERKERQKLNAQTDTNTQPKTIKHQSQNNNKHGRVFRGAQGIGKFKTPLEMYQHNAAQNFLEDMGLKKKEAPNRKSAKWEAFVQQQLKAFSKQGGSREDTQQRVEQSQDTEVEATKSKSPSNKRKKDDDDVDGDKDYVDENSKPQSKKPARDPEKAQERKSPNNQTTGEGKKPPRQHSARARVTRDNFTLPVQGQTHWSVDNLPDILYTFRPTARHAKRTDDVPTKLSPYSELETLRSFSILPDRISSNVEEFRVEAWMRLDRRIQLRDITDRMHPHYRIGKNTLQQRGVRFRQAFKLLAWGSGSKKTDQNEQDLLQEMRLNGIDPSANSTRGLTPGLINPHLGEAGGRIPAPNLYKDRYEADKAAGVEPTTDTTASQGTTAYNNQMAPPVSSDSNPTAGTVGHSSNGFPVPSMWVPNLGGSYHSSELLVPSGSNPNAGATAYSNPYEFPVFPGEVPDAGATAYSNSSGYPIPSNRSTYGGATAYNSSIGYPITSGGSAYAGATAYNSSAGYPIPHGGNPYVGTTAYNSSAGYPIPSEGNHYAAVTAYNSSAGYPIPSEGNPYAAVTAYNSSAGYPITSAGNPYAADTAYNSSIGYPIASAGNPYAGATAYNSSIGYPIPHGGNPYVGTTAYGSLNGYPVPPGGNSHVGATAYSNPNGLPLPSSQEPGIQTIEHPSSNELSLPSDNGHNGGFVGYSNPNNEQAGASLPTGPNNTAAGAGAHNDTSEGLGNNVKGHSTQNVAINVGRDDVMDTIEENIPQAEVTYAPEEPDDSDDDEPDDDDDDDYDDPDVSSESDLSENRHISSGLQAEGSPQAEGFPEPEGSPEPEETWEEAQARILARFSEDEMQEDQDPLGPTLADLDAIYGDADFGDFGFTNPKLFPTSPPPPARHLDDLFDWGTNRNHKSSMESFTYGVPDPEKEQFDETLRHFGLYGTYSYQEELQNTPPEFEILTKADDLDKELAATREKAKKTGEQQDKSVDQEGQTNEVNQTQPSSK